MSYRLINANALNGVISNDDYEKVLNAPCIFADLPNGLDGEHYNLQEPKTGHWIEDDMTYCGVELTNYKCDKCGEIGGSWRKGLKPNQLPKYCQWCGAKMGEMKE